MNLEAFLAMAFAPSALNSIVTFLTVMAVVALVEIAIPLKARTPGNIDHLAPNFALTAVYIATNLFFTAAIVLMLIWLGEIGFGLFNALDADPLVETLAIVVILDFQTYAVHVAMHEHSGLWRFHRVHHADPAVDVTTALRQHPGESLIRFVSLAVFAAGIGASPAAFALYRLLSGMQALSEHANIRLPRRVDSALSWLIATPNFHKVHHSRDAAETDTNYANILTIWDRLFWTATPAHRGIDVDYGLDGFDGSENQSAWGVFALPFKNVERPRTADA